MGASFVRVSDYSSMSLEAAKYVLAFLSGHPSAVLALPTGRTPQGLYRELGTASSGGRADLARATVFNLDELVGFRQDDPASFASALRREIVQPIGLSGSRCHLLDGAAKYPEAECERFEALILASGKIDLAILGLGWNGHIAFNEPGTDWDALTHVAQLAEGTRKRLALLLGEGVEPPTQALTMGIRDIMSADSILLLVHGSEKSRPLHRAFSEPPHPAIPASVLQLHADVTVIADASAFHASSR
jgi:glucosamine-6-phosphate deaminase